ncbi:hypothetical protein J5N97_019482 [Dioscorea zingiberensis]|uniref:Pentatricopeptide repeat-containing protein n=1 Tax=Dioscorea zingiberensis TaxID=325984 RepID=A0A9D5HCX3_9LILI|nr:hypothetical protein J5N97_019482 [Dioscorea zingiberensis]
MSRCFSKSTKQSLSLIHQRSSSLYHHALKFSSFNSPCECLSVFRTLSSQCRHTVRRYASEAASHQVTGQKSIHGVEKTKFSVGPAIVDETSASDCRRTISEDSEKICVLLSNQPSSKVTFCLDKSGVQMSPELVVEVLKKLSNAGMLALAFFRWAEKQPGFKHTTEIFHRLIEALGKIKQFRLVWSLVESMSVQRLLTKETFGLITRRYARARKIKEAIDAFERMQKYGLSPELSDYNCLIDTISKSKHVTEAHEIFNDMKRRKRFSPDLKTYTILLEAWGKDRDLSEMNAVYLEMLDAGFEPDVVTYGILINAFCKSKKHDEAMKTFHEMEAKGIKPSPHIYCSLINGLGSDKRLNEALAFFEQSKARGFAPELPTYNAVVGSYCSVLQFEDAFRLMDEMRCCGIGPNARTYEIILHHLIKAEKTEEAYGIFLKMSGEPGCEPELNTYSMMVTMFCSKERVDMALKIWKQMNDKGVLPCMHMFSSLINGLCFENRLDEACRYFQEMLDKGIRPPGQLYGNLKEALIDGGKRDLAINLGLKLDRLRKTPLLG